MAKTKPTPQELTPEQCLDQLPALELDIEAEETGELFRRVDLRQSVLKIAELDHESEILLVKATAANAIGKLPGLDE